MSKMNEPGFFLMKVEDPTTGEKFLMLGVDLPKDVENYRLKLDQLGGETFAFRLGLETAEALGEDLHNLVIEQRIEP